MSWPASFTLAAASLMEHIGTALGYALAVLIASAVTSIQNHLDRRRRYRPHRSVESTIEQDIAIRVILAVIGEQLGAMRCYFSQYHNGGMTLADSDIIRKTRTHEWVRPGVAYQAESFKGMLVSAMADETELVRQDGPSLTLVRDLEASKFRWLCQEGGARAVARSAVKKRGQIVGFVGVDFDYERTELTDEECETIRSACERIERIVAGNN